MSNAIRRIESPGAPAPVGPYSQAIAAGGFVFCAGQIPLDPATGKLVEGPIDVQAERVLANLKAVLEAAGSSLARVVKATVFLADLDDFGGMNAVYSRHFTSDPKPARTTIQAARLPAGARVEIEVVAAL
ncbi:MAG TPA: RidA family protein [Myxococcota bacterium]|nr:RidA family protein [Myxococcota bacterium]